MAEQEDESSVSALIAEGKLEEAKALLDGIADSPEVQALREVLELKLKQRAARLEYLEEYVAENRRQYTDEGIIEKLEEAGYALEEIYEAMRRDAQSGKGFRGINRIDQICETIAQEQYRVPRNVLTKRLLGEGYEQEEIDHAYALVRKHSPQLPDMDSTDWNRWFWGLILTVAAILLLIYLRVAVMVFLLYPIALIWTLALWVKMIASSRSTSLGRFLMILVAFVGLPILLIFVIPGACIAYLE